MYIEQKQLGKKRKKDSIRFEQKLIETRQERLEKMELLKKEINSFLQKYKIDDRDAKIVLKEVLKTIEERCKL